VSDEPEMLKTLFADAEVRRLELRPGDLVVLKCDATLTSQECDAILESARHFFPGHRIVIVQPGFDIGVMGPPE
jgi:hypothetical protein